MSRYDIRIMADKKTVVMGISASIAAYKSCDLVRSLVKKKYDVHVILTPNAERFVGKVTWQALSGNRAFSSEWEEGMLHIELKNLADIFVVVPATANCIAKLAHGIADDIVSSTYLALDCPVLVAPAMNPTMYAAVAVQRNLATLREGGVGIIEAVGGEVLCGDTGQGKMAPIESIEETIEKTIKRHE